MELTDVAIRRPAWGLAYESAPSFRLSLKSGPFDFLKDSLQAEWFSLSSPVSLRQLETLTSRCQRISRNLRVTRLVKVASSGNPHTTTGGSLRVASLTISWRSVDDPSTIRRLVPTLGHRSESIVQFEMPATCSPSAAS